MSSGPYDTIIRVSCVDGVGPVLATLAARAMGVEKTFKSMGSAIQLALGGAAAIFAGDKLLKGILAFEEAGEKLVHVKTLFEAALPAATRLKDIGYATDVAWAETHKNMRTSIEGNISLMHDFYNVTQSVTESGRLLPYGNVMRNVLDSVKEGTDLGSLSKTSGITAAVRALDIAGRTTTEALIPATKSLTGTAIMLGNRFDPGKYLTQVQSSGDARFQWSDDFLTKGLPVMQALGLGNRAGSSIYQLHSNLYGGGGGALASQIQADAQVHWGLHKESDKMFVGKKFKGFKPGSEFEAGLEAENQILWANAFRDHLKGMGVDIESTKQMALVVAEVARGNKFLKVNLDELLLPKSNAQFNREMEKRNAMGDDAASFINDNDPRGIHQALAAQWESLKDAIGEPLVKPLLDNVYKPLTSMLSDMSDWASNNPDTVTRIASDLGILGAALVGFGSVLVLGGIGAALGFSPLLGIAAAVGGVVYGLNALNEYAKTQISPEQTKATNDKIDAWVKSMKSTWKNLDESFKGGGWFANDPFKDLFNSINRGVDHISGAIMNAPFKDAVDFVNIQLGWVTDTIKSWASRLLDTIKSFFSSNVPGVASPPPNMIYGPNDHVPSGSTIMPEGEKHSSLVPPNSTQPIIIQNSLSIDPRKLAQSITSVMVSSATFPTSSGGADNYGQWSPPSAYPSNIG